MAKAEIAGRVAEMLKLIGLSHLADRYPYQMSGGQQQRVALARALAPKPQVLLLDEPLSALDAKIRVSLREEIRSIQKSLGITTIFVTHDQEEALSISDRIVVMYGGKAEQVGSPFEIYNRPATKFVANFVGTLNVLESTVTDAGTGLVRVGTQDISVLGKLNGRGRATPSRSRCVPKPSRWGAGRIAMRALPGKSATCISSDRSSASGWRRIEHGLAGHVQQSRDAAAAGGRAHGNQFSRRTICSSCTEVERREAGAPSMGRGWPSEPSAGVHCHGWRDGLPACAFPPGHAVGSRP